MIWRNIFLVRVNFSFFYTVKCYNYYWIHEKTAHSAHCGNYGILLPRFFLQKFRQITILVKKCTINWFDGKKFAWQWISRLSTLCSANKNASWYHITVRKITIKRDHDFYGKINIFPSNQHIYLQKKFLKRWFHGKLLSVIAFWTTLWWFQLNFFKKHVAFTKFLSKWAWSRFTGTKELAFTFQCFYVKIKSFSRKI